MNDKPLQVGEIGTLIYARSPETQCFVGLPFTVIGIESRGIPNEYRVDNPYARDEWGLNWYCKFDQLRRLHNPDADQSRETEKPIEADA